MQYSVLRTLSQGLSWHNFTAFNCIIARLSQTQQNSLICILCLEQNCLDGMPRIVTIVHTETKNSMEEAVLLSNYQSINHEFLECPI